ncbi:MAG: ATP-binding protein, partial [Oscillospiraceae bacterium]|nr:ATP-binding protein [Oscillospiraceae bacterium]MCL2280202.1 ATP-binding protein [Oscillospiraceae bacterium]
WRETYMEKLRGFIDEPELVKILTGLRRSGKSVMLEMVRLELKKKGVSGENVIMLNFEDMELDELKDAKKLHSYLKSKIESIKGRTYLFFDELQEVDNWESCINSLRMSSDTDIYITGSNSKMLSGEFATKLSGRYIQIQVYPFSLREYSMAMSYKKRALSEADLFMQYLKQGGMPFPLKAALSESDTKQYLQDLHGSVVIKDIMKRNNIRDVDLLERIIAYVMANIGKSFSANSLSKFFKSEQRTVAPETILNYLKYCEDAYLFGKIKRLDISGKKILQVQEKYYVADHGLRQAVYGHNERDIELVLENMVCLELWRRGYTVTVGRVGEKEIDFLGDKDGKRIYIQVCYLLASEKTVTREFGAYYSIADNFPKYVLSMDNVDMSRDGITHQNISYFLLSDSF